MKKSTGGLKALFLASTMALLPNLAGANDNQSENTTTEQNQATTATSEKIRYIPLAKEECTPDSLSMMVQNDRVTLLVDMDQNVQQMQYWEKVLPDIIAEYAPRIEVPMDIIVLNSEDRSAPSCFHGLFNHVYNIATLYDGAIININRVVDDSNPTYIDAILDISFHIEDAQENAKLINVMKNIDRIIEGQKQSPSQQPESESPSVQAMPRRFSI